MDRQSRSGFFEQRMAEWQSLWHDAFDGDAALIALGEFGRPDPLPKDVVSDYRLIFGLMQARPETRTRCMAALPEGAEMDRRLTTYLITPFVALSEEQARAALPDVLRILEPLAPDAVRSGQPVQVVDRTTRDGLNALGHADDPAWLLRGRRGDQTIRAAEVFLKEPLYAAAGNFSHLANWVTSAMSDGPEAAIHRALYDLWRGGWQVGLGAKEIILARRDLPRADAADAT